MLSTIRLRQDVPFPPGRPGDPHSPYRYGTHVRGRLRGRILVFNQVVRLRRTRAASAPDTTENAAEALMAAAADGHA
ncbi:MULTISPECIES: hypothetical protein [Streptomyces]|uniref:Uncharacterized protein n=2 Tax=Streptomyces TaxID=1883 RepID=A0ABV9IWY7_9ACTN